MNGCVIIEMIIMYLCVLNSASKLGTVSDTLDDMPQDMRNS